MAVALCANYGTIYIRSTTDNREGNIMRNIIFIGIITDKHTGGIVEVIRVRQTTFRDAKALVCAYLGSMIDEYDFTIIPQSGINDVA